MNMAKRPVPRYDFKAFEEAIKTARKGRKESRKKVCDEMYISPRYLANIENKGQPPAYRYSLSYVALQYLGRPFPYFCPPGRSEIACWEVSQTLCIIRGCYPLSIG